MSITKNKETVEIIDLEEMQRIISPLTDKAIETLIQLLDRYVDRKMIDVIKTRINENKPINPNDEVGLRGVLEFRTFITNLLHTKK